MLAAALLSTPAPPAAPSHPAIRIQHVAARPTPSGPNFDTDGNYTISWNKPSGIVTSYKLQEKRNSGSWNTIYTGSGTSKYRSGKTTANYYYKVKACHDSACSGWSPTKAVVVEVTGGDDGGMMKLHSTDEDLLWPGRWDPFSIGAVSPAGKAATMSATQSGIRQVGVTQEATGDFAVRHPQRPGEVTYAYAPTAAEYYGQITRQAVSAPGAATATGAEGSRRAAFDLASDLRPAGDEALGRQTPDRDTRYAARSFERSSGDTETLKPVRPLRNDPRLLAAFEARGGHLPVVIKRASLGNQPTGTYTHAVRRVYDDYGHLVMVHAANLDGTPGETYWQALQADPFGGIAKAFVGDVNSAGERLEEVRLVNLATGRLEAAQTGVGLSSGGSPGIVDMDFAWDLAGNLTSRSEANVGAEEHFCYDGLSRLTGSEVGASISCGSGSGTGEWMAYDTKGSLTTKGDYSAYRYVAGSHHVDEMDWTDPVTQATSTIGFSYDANGNILTKGGASYTWSSYNKPTQMTTGTGVSTQFRYGADRSRYKQVVMDGATTATTIYVGALYERHSPGDGSTQHRLQVFAGSRMVAQVKLSSSTGTTTKTEFFHHDHLGSIVAVTDAEHALLPITEGGRLSYDAWGKRRDGQTWASPAEGTFLANQAATRGYTGHEHLPHAGLIHMNGRVYDPQIGRFMSADSYVQFPDSAQSYNRYAYVSNNPLRYSDPSGHLATLLVPLFASLNIAAAPYCLATSAISTMMMQAAVTGAFIDGFVGSKGNFGHAIGGAAAAFVGAKAAGFGKAAFAENLGARALYHGVTQGALTAATGGRFGDGALGAFSATLGGSALNSQFGPGPGQTVAAAILGGTIAKIGGGKFASGAISAAMENLFNAQASDRNGMQLPTVDDDNVILTSEEAIEVFDYMYKGKTKNALGLSHWPPKGELDLQTRKLAQQLLMSMAESGEALTFLQKALTDSVPIGRILGIRGATRTRLTKTAADWGAEKLRAREKLFERQIYDRIRDKAALNFKPEIGRQLRGD